jgi:hypothetical protein
MHELADTRKMFEGLPTHGTMGFLEDVHSFVDTPET